MTNVIAYSTHTHHKTCSLIRRVIVRHLRRRTDKLKKKQIRSTLTHIFINNIVELKLRLSNINKSRDDDNGACFCARPMQQRSWAILLLINQTHEMWANYGDNSTDKNREKKATRRWIYTPHVTRHTGAAADIQLRQSIDSNMTLALFMFVVLVNIGIFLSICIFSRNDHDNRNGNTHKGNIIDLDFSVELTLNEKLCDLTEIGAAHRSCYGRWS